MLYEAGAAEVHVRIACPQIKFPDFYGVDMPTKEELLAHEKNINEMTESYQSNKFKIFKLRWIIQSFSRRKKKCCLPSI